MSLRDDERGAILVLGVFMALFATGCLAYVVGIGEAIWQRERMQDGADAAAFSAAVLHARGMNLIALINMTMAALLAVLVALKLAQMVVLTALVFAYGAAYFSAGASSGLIPPLTKASIKIEQAHTKLEKQIHPALKALRVAARGVRVAIPWVAQARTIQTLVTHYDPPVRIGFVVPDRITLPTRDGTFEELCDKSGEYVGDLVALPISWIPGVGDLASDATSGLIDAGSDYFCNARSSKPPQLRTEVEMELPILPAREACHSYVPTDELDMEHERLCAEAEEEMKRSLASIDSGSGECLEDCGREGIWEQRIVGAIDACAPRDQGDDALDRFEWQEYRFTRRYEMRDGTWGIREDILEGSESTRRRITDTRPCGSDDALIDPEWNAARRNDDGVLVPVCEQSDAPSEPGWDGQVLDLEQVQVLHVFGCRETTLKEQTLSEGRGSLTPQSESDQNAMAPQRMEGGVVLGERDFQLRGAVIGRLSGGGPEGLLARFKHAEATANVPWRAARELGRFALAQAEYFFAMEGSTADPDTFLWSMRWQARLRRFRLAEAREQTRNDEDESEARALGIGTVLGKLEDACKIAAKAHSDIDCNVLDLTVETLVVH